MPSAITTSHPLFAVDGSDMPSLAGDLAHLEVCQRRDGLASLEATFMNWGATADTPGEHAFRYFDGVSLGLGRQLKVAVGEPGAEQVIFLGTITAVRGRFAEGATPRVVVRAEDDLWKLRMTQRTRVHEEASDADVVDTIARDASLTAQADATGATVRQGWQVNQSDLAQLRERARSADAWLAAMDGELGFLPASEGTEPAIELSRLTELIHLEVDADLAHQRTEVHVHGWSVADKAPIHATSTESDVSAMSPGGTVGPKLLEELSVDAIEHVHLEMPSTEAEATQLAKAFMLRRARRFVWGRGTTRGTPQLRTGGKVKLLDVGDWFTGTYLVAEVRHTWDTRVGLRTHFLAERVSIGGGQ